MTTKNSEAGGSWSADDEGDLERLKSGLIASSLAEYEAELGRDKDLVPGRDCACRLERRGGKLMLTARCGIHNTDHVSFPSRPGARGAAPSPEKHS